MQLVDARAPRADTFGGHLLGCNVLTRAFAGGRVADPFCTADTPGLARHPDTDRQLYRTGARLSTTLELWSIPTLEM